MAARDLSLRAFVTSVFLVVSCTGEFSYDYSKHGTDWLQGMCGSRERQSPINFNILDTQPTGKLTYNYQTVQTSFELANNGHAFSADFAGLGYGGVNYEESWYNLLNVNIHALSEHTFKGVHYPLELHFVHKKYDTEDLLIIAVPITSSEQAMTLLQEQRIRQQRWETRAIANRTSTKFAFLGAAAPASAPASSPGLADQVAEQALKDAGLTPEALEAAVCGQGCLPTVSPEMAYPTPNGGDFVLPTQEPDHYFPPSGDEPLFNKQLQHFLSAPLPLVNEKQVFVVDELHPLNLGEFLENGVYFEYAGSMTAPPCAEAATWFVRRDPVKASETQVKLLSDNIFQMTADFGNFRATMPVNGRPIATRTIIKETAPPAPPPSAVPLGPLPRTDREFQAMKWARDALHLSKTASDYIHGLDRKLQRAAQAHVSALAPDLYPDYKVRGPDPEVVKRPSAVDMTKTAAVMAKAIATAAKQAVADAASKIAREAEQAARDAAREAATVATENMVMPTTPPPLGLPPVPAGAGPAFAPAPAGAGAPGSPGAKAMMAPATAKTM